MLTHDDQALRGQFLLACLWQILFIDAFAFWRDFEEELFGASLSTWGKLLPASLWHLLFIDAFAYGGTLKKSVCEVIPISPLKRVGGGLGGLLVGPHNLAGQVTACTWLRSFHAKPQMIIPYDG